MAVQLELEALLIVNVLTWCMLLSLAEPQCSRLENGDPWAGLNEKVKAKPCSSSLYSILYLLSH